MAAVFRFLAFCVLASLTLVSIGCAGNPQAENAAEFRERAESSPHDVSFALMDDGRPGTVTGVMRSPDGVPSTFSFSFGPGPDKLPDPVNSGGVIWLGAGDGLEYWIEDLPEGLKGARLNRVIRVRNAISDIGCRIASGRDCLG